MEALLFGIPLIVVTAAFIGAVYSTKEFKSKRETRIGRIVDYLIHFTLAFLSALVLYSPISAYFGLPPDLNGFMALILSMTFHNIANGFTKLSKDKDAIRDFIIRLLGGKK